MRTREAPSVPASLESAYSECIAIARSHYENFSVASRLMPRDMLPHVAAIYTYCRGVDDLGDEAEGRPPCPVGRLGGATGAVLFRLAD